MRWRKEEGSLGKPPLTFSLAPHQTLLGRRKIGGKASLWLGSLLLITPGGWRAHKSGQGEGRERRVETQTTGARWGRGLWLCEEDREEDEAAGLGHSHSCCSALPWS